MNGSIRGGCLALGLVLLVSVPAHAGTLQVIAIEPAANALSAPVSTPITVTFSEPIDMATVDSNTLWAFGRWSGTAGGSYQVSPDGLTVTLTPSEPFSAGESVMVILSHDLASQGGSNLRDEGYSWQFWTASQPGTLNFQELDQFSTRAFPSEAVRSYGGFGSDLNNDGYLDLAIINEDSFDVRVFLNTADGSGLFEDFLTPPSSIGVQASPNEPTDFDRDGNVDFCVCNAVDGTISVLLGNGDGTFAPQQVISVGSSPHGIAVLDADGDGDVDIVNSNTGSGNMCLHLNDGNGIFGAPIFFEGGISGEWAVSAADFNGDGVLDIVVGSLNSEIAVNLSTGNGSFITASTLNGVGSMWMFATGDVDGDTDADVAAIDNGGNAALFRGNGQGGLTGPETYGIDACGVATDLGDVDGDGDLDWVTSSFCGDFSLFTNDGAGNFTFVQEFPAPSNGSCALIMDIDNDADLDLALVDEIADIVVIQEQLGSPPGTLFIRGDANDDGQVNIGDPVTVLDYLFNAGALGCLATGDCNGDGQIDVADAVYELGYLFDDGPPPAAPFPDCGTGAGALGCASYASCP